jgi:predicted short-subunit dehydrogenase-like oxidoreductase (DUF2520 family)
VADFFNIAFVGSGNVAWHLAPALENAGHRVVELYSRNPKNAKSLQKRLYNAEISPSLDFATKDIDIVLLCVSDDAIEQVADHIMLPQDAVLAHTSGAQPLSKLGYGGTENLGVFYPLQTFTKGTRVDFQDVPLLIEAENRTTANLLKKLASSISQQVLRVDASKRMAVHVSAVFACNFTNYLLSVSEALLERSGLELELLRPLIAETLNKSLDIGPEKAQTGPAVRGDLETLDKHMEFLSSSAHRDLYQLITEKILNR